MNTLFEVMEVPEAEATPALVIKECEHGGILTAVLVGRGRPLGESHHEKSQFSLMFVPFHSVYSLQTQMPNRVYYYFTVSTWGLRSSHGAKKHG